MRRFVIDTDTASDDAVALVMALQAKDVEVEAITVVAGNVPLDKALQAALYTVELCGKSTPVYAGLQGPMLHPLTTAEAVHGHDGLGDIGLPLKGRTPAEGHAVDVLIEKIGGSPGEITLVTLGPLSNVGVALLQAPSLAQKVKHCYVMGGTGHLPGNVTPAAEFNIYVDPEAARIVFESGMPITMIGWDASMAFGFIEPEVEAEIRGIGTPLARFVCDIQSHLTEFMVQLSGKSGFDLPDPLAMAVALDPSIAETEDYYVEVITGEGPARGQTVLDVWRRHGKKPNASVVRHISPSVFQSMLKDAVH